jgi:alcohol dehydrogenase class IV
MGVDEAMVEPLIPHAVADHTTASNPRPLAAADYQALFKETLG